MATRSKNTLKEFFQTGFRPTESNFADLIDSFVHKNTLTEDGIVLNDQTLTVSRGLRLIGGDPATASPPNEAGTIRWNAVTASFEVNTDGSADWNPLGEGVWDQVGADIAYRTGNIIAGNAVSGGAVMGTMNSGTFSGWAVMGHQSDISAGSFAMGQSPDGAIAFVARANEAVEINHQTGQYASFSTGGISLFGNVTVNGQLTATGNIITNGNFVDTTPSDERLKEDIEPLDRGLDVLKKLNVIKFKYNGKGGFETDRQNFGVLAQDIQKILPELVHTRLQKLSQDDAEETEILTVDVKSLLFVLCQGVKELVTKVENIQNELDELVFTDSKRKI